MANLPSAHLIFFISFFAITGCTQLREPSPSNEQTTTPPEVISNNTENKNLTTNPSSSNLKIDVFLARSSLSKTHFEYHHLEGDALFQECGLARISKNTLSKEEGNRISTYQRPALSQESSKNSEKSNSNQELYLFTDGQDLQLLEDNKIKKLKELVANLNLTSDDNKQKDSPESSRKKRSLKSSLSIAKPGIAEIEISLGEYSKKFSTSVDELADSESTELLTLRNILSELRASNFKLCDNQSFFGLR